MNYIKLTAIVVFLSTIASCKDKPLFDSIPGKYKVDVEVVRRPAVYPRTTDPVEGYMQDFHGVYIDTGSVCCQDWGTEHGCPMTYSFDPFEIIKNGQGYAIQNETEDRDFDGNQVLFNILLDRNGDDLSYNGVQGFSRSLHLASFVQDDIPDNDPLPWPKVFDLYHLHLEKKSRTKLEGEWFFMDVSSRCQFTSFGEYALMGEYAKITLTKID
ncbi:MAG: hypothetical protein P8N47_06285 [Bacteroidia bacterium]|jgi:hypothetical protein|nr:hypothetical protein [Bacteroidia bacterium]